MRAKHGVRGAGARHMGVSAAQVARLPLPAVAGNSRPHDAQLLPARASAPLRSPLSAVLELSCLRGLTMG